MQIGTESPFIFLVIIFAPIGLVIMGVHAVWVGIKSLFGFG
jgi:hypothetical protein